MNEQILIALMQEKAYRPMLFDELCEALSLHEDTDRFAFKEQLLRLEQDGRVVRTRTARFALAKKMDLLIGLLQVKSRGFGFVSDEDEPTKEWYISAGDMGGAMDGDRVMVRKKRASGGSREEGEIIRVLKRARTTVVGTLKTYTGYGFVAPDDKHLSMAIFVAGEHLYHAVDGQKVVVEITAYPDTTMQSATGVIKEVLGFPNDPGVDILAIVRKFGIPERFPIEVLEAAERIEREIDEREIAKRKDLRDEVIVTIDGKDAKDLDDAVSVKVLDNGHVLLGVHIADVSYYVKENSLLDQEAYRRATSVYLVDRVIPMLPPRLSNGICSLNPQEDRLTLTCEMEFSPSLEMVRHDLYPSVIRTTERMTYQDVNTLLLDEDEVLQARYAPLITMFFAMRDLAMRLRERRMDRGAVDFHMAETKIQVDEEGHPIGLVQRTRNIAEMIIEEFMLAANETVAEHFFWMEAPFLYRIHEAPSVEKMMALNEFVHHFGYHVKAATHVHPKALQNLLESVRGKREETVISYVTLRSLKQARYSAENLGHFGLSAKYYTHFTSPIRRYPDLIVHRILRELMIDVRMDENRRQNWLARLPEIATHTSERERNATDAERETDLIKKIEFMQDKVGQTFDGMISGVTGFGFFVQLDNSVEGLVHVSYLHDDYYHYHETLHALIGERFKRTYRIGDRVRVTVATAKKEQLSIDFSMVEKLEEDDDLLVASLTAQPARKGRSSASSSGKGAGKGVKRFGKKKLLDHRPPKGKKPGSTGGTRELPSRSSVRNKKQTKLYLDTPTAPTSPAQKERDKKILREIQDLYGVSVKDKAKPKKKPKE